jgi:hypothetical protein
LHQGPTAQDDENTNGVKPEARQFEPDQSQNRQRACREIAPIGRWKNAMLVVSREEMEISDEKNCQPLRDIDPKEAFHRIGLAGKSR